MLAIIANINSTHFNPVIETPTIHKLAKTQEGLQVKYVFTIQELERIIEENKKKGKVLFSNFPPDISFSEKNQLQVRFDTDGGSTKYWNADSYSKSTIFFRSLLERYSFKQVYFITGAPVRKLTDNHLKTLHPGTNISVVRKDDWINSGAYFEHYDFFISEKITSLNNTDLL